jgi:hypothetical protein
MIRRRITQFRAEGSVCLTKPAQGAHDLHGQLRKQTRCERASLLKESSKVNTTQFPRTWSTQIVHAHDSDKELGAVPLEDSTCSTAEVSRTSCQVTICSSVPCPVGGSDFHKTLKMSDEAQLYLNGFVSKHNYRIWASEQPFGIHQGQLHDAARVTVRFGIMERRVLGPFFLKTVTTRL